jgi:hypothetical protein
MSSAFTAKAKILWDSIPLQIQKQLINNVWCSHCSSATTITDFRGDVEEGDLVLTGNCIKCGGSVVRVIENE